MKYPASHAERRCAQCRGPMVMLSRKFSAPNSKDLAQWAKVKFLIEHGFRFYSVYEPHESGGMVRVAYPKTLREAEGFVVRYQAEAKRQMPNHAFNPDALARAGYIKHVGPNEF
jgi:hypothetical protein